MLRAAIVLLIVLGITVAAQTIPLKYVGDWNNRPLYCGTVFVFDANGNVLDRVRVVNGVLERPLTALNASVVRIAWGFADSPAEAIWIYDSSIEKDVLELGNALESDKVRTYVYPLTITVRDSGGRPLSGYRVVVAGLGFYSVAITDADGGAQIADSKCGIVFSQVPPMSYRYYVYDPNGLLVANGTFSIQRGALPPTTGFNVVVTVGAPAGGVGHAVVKGVRFSNGSLGAFKIPVELRGTVLNALGEVPGWAAVEVYLSALPAGNATLPAKGGSVLVYNGTAEALTRGVSLLELGLYGELYIRVVNGSGAPMRNAEVVLTYGGQIVARGVGEVRALLPKTPLLGAPYVVAVTAKIPTPSGRPYEVRREVPLEASNQSVTVQIPTAKVVAVAVNGFGEVKDSWEIAIVNVTSGRGRAEAYVIQGERYVAKASGLNFTATEVFTAAGPQTLVRVVIPTGKIVAQVVDGFGNVRNDWTVQIVGPVEVLAGQYTVKTTVFGQDFTQTVNVGVGQTAQAQIQVPTAKLSITVLDDDKKPIDQYVSEVHISGPLTLSYSTAPKDIEVLAGTYTVKVTALGKDATVEVSLNAGEVKNIEVMVPGTRPQPPYYIFAPIIAIIIAATTAVWILKRRRRAAH